MYKIRKKVKDTIKNKYIVEQLDLSNTYVSELLNEKRVIPKHSAYAIASLYGKEIKDLFEKVGK